MSTSAEIRTRLDHPVIDADGHTIEFMPAVREHLKDVAGGEAAAELFSSPGNNPVPFAWYRRSHEARLAERRARPPWWGLPAENTLDRTTAILPRLMYERLDETGVDFAIVYPTAGLFALGTPMAEPRRALCRAFNEYHAEVFGPYRDRLCPVALIPNFDPAEAIEELDHAVGTLGFKAVLMAGVIPRPLEASSDPRHATWIDHLGVDSAHDYDPLWRRCLELGVAPTFHSSGMGWGSRNSVSSYMFNHIGNFAAAGEAVCKSLFFAGVTRRFPALRFGFLEGGTGWAVNLYNDIVGHYEKRNREAVRCYDPRRIDLAQMESLFRAHGDRVLARLDPGSVPGHLAAFAVNEEDDATIDEWAAVGLERAEDVRERFVPSFFFGCEADDRMNAMAFDTRLNAFGARLNAVFSSDIGHWDVPDIREVLEEAHELVAEGSLTEADFRDFTFANATRLYGEVNPAFFEGTVVADACRAELGTPSAAAD